MDSTTPAQPRLRIPRQSALSPWSGSDHYLQVPQAGPSRLSPQMNAFDALGEDDDSQATPRVPTRPQLETPSDATPSNSVFQTGSARLRAILAKENEHEQTSRRPSSPPPPRRRYDSMSDMESDFESPHATVAQSQHLESLKEIFTKFHADTTPRNRRSSGRRNSIDLSEVEDSPRVERVREERAMHKGKRRSASDEEAEIYTKSSEGSEISRHAASAAKYGALQDKLDSSLRTPRVPQDPSRGTAFSMGRGMSGAEELLGLEPPTDMDMSAEGSGDTARLLRHLEGEASTSTAPVATSTPMRSLQLPSHFHSQSNLLDHNSDMENAMKGLESEEEKSGIRPRGLPFPSSRQNGRDPSPDAASRAHGKPHSAHKLPLPRRVSSGSGGRDSISSRSSSLSASDFHDRLRGGDQDKLYERERQWNKSNGKSPAHSRTPESTRRVSQGSPSQNGAPTGDRGSPGQGVARRSSSASMQGFRDGRSSMSSSISSRADYQERMADLDNDKIKERERLWNKPQLRRSSSSLSFNSSGERSRTNSTTSRPDSAQAFNRIDGRPTSWYPSGPVQGSSRLESPAGSIGSVDKEGRIGHERERNWNSPHPKWELQVPRSLSPLPPSPPVPGTGYGRPPPDWDPNKEYESPSRSRHSSLTNGGRFPYERSRTSSLSDRFPPSKPEPALARASTDSRIDRSHSPAQSETGSEDRGKEASSRFGWAFPRRRANLPPFESDFESPQKRPSTPPTRPDNHLSARPSSIPIRSPGRRDEDRSSSARARNEDDQEGQKGHRRTSASFIESMGRITQRSRIEPEDLINHDLEVEDLVPTDIESGSDVESQATSTPVGRPTTLPSPHDPGPGPSSLSRTVESPEQYETAEFPETFVTASSPELSPVKKEPPEPLFGLSTPPRRPFLNTSKLEFQTPSPPRDLPELPGPPSSSEDEDQEGTPVRARVSLLADFTAAKTPRPPGAWAATPVPPPPVEKNDPPPVMELPPPPPEAETPVPASANNTLSAIPTPAPPGAWQPTPLGSVRRKSILKVRFDMEQNTSGESIPEVPIVGPSDPADSISDVFPLVAPVASSSKITPQSAAIDQIKVEAPERPSTPPTIRARSRLKSPGLRMLDAFGREAVDESPTPSAPSSMKNNEAKPTAPAPNPPSLDATPRSKSMVRIVDAMGREVADEEPLVVEDNVSSMSMLPPTDRREALARLRETISHMADDLGESDDSRVVATRDDHRLNELYRKSQAAKTARKDLSESLQRQRVADPSSLGKVGSAMRNKLLPPAFRSSRFSIDFLNTWVLWSFLILQIFILVYMYRLSTIRAKQIFLTTYYDAFSPALFSHLSKNPPMHHATPPASSPTPSSFSIADALTRDGWKVVLTEVWARTTIVIAEWQNHLWDVWGQHPGRTNAWPPT